MPDQTIPRAEFGICGGSGTLSRFDFPAALADDRVTVLAERPRLRHALRPLACVHALPRRRRPTVRARRSPSGCTAGGAA